MTLHRGDRMPGLPARVFAACGAVAIAALAGPAWGETLIDPDDLERLQALSIEQLSQVEVMSVARRPQPLSEAPSAIFAISADDIRRSGAPSLAEVLRLAPNLQVSRVDARDYAISARGLNSFETANKLLVLIDGRSVMSPLYSGVEWDQQLVALEDIERIEVVSGPGGALWGSNAVNGVINVISRSAFDTQGPAAALNVGSVDQRLSLRYGGRIAETGAYRAYVAAYGRGPTLNPATGEESRDRWDGIQGGFRSDFHIGDNSLTLQGDAYDAALEDLFISNERLSGGNLLARWSQPLLGGRLDVQAYYDRAHRVARGVFEDTRTYDAEARFSRTLNRHTLLMGGGLRTSRDEFVNRINNAVLDPPNGSIDLANLFFQDEIALSDRMTLTAGVRVEDSSFHGTEWAPNLRLAFRPTGNTLLWAAASRAIRSPSRIERELVIPPLVEKGTFGPETVEAYEAGVRATPTGRLSFSISVFYNRYDDVRSNATTPVTVFPVRVANGLQGETWGLEAWGQVKAASWWRLSAGLSILGKDFRVKPGETDISGLKAAGNDPSYQLILRSVMTLPRRLELSADLRLVDELPKPSVNGYAGLNARLAWRASETVELAIGGQNLLNDGRMESAESRSSESRRNVYVETRWRY